MRNFAKWIVLAVFAALSYSAHANVTYYFNGVFSGASPSGTSPWLSATFADGGTAGHVTLTMDASNLSSGEFVSDFFFNLDPSLQASSLSYTYVSGVAYSGLDTVTNDSKADGDGLYDIRFLFPTASGDRLGVGSGAAGSSSVYDIFGSELNANAFYFLSCQKSDGCQSAGGAGPFYAAAHIQGIPGSLSAWVAPIPEPADAAMLVAGLALMAFLARRRKAMLEAA